MIIFYSLLVILHGFLVTLHGPQQFFYHGFQVNSHWLLGIFLDLLAILYVLIIIIHEFLIIFPGPLVIFHCFLVILHDIDRGRTFVWWLGWVHYPYVSHRSKVHLNILSHLVSAGRHWGLPAFFGHSLPLLVLGSNSYNEVQKREVQDLSIGYTLELGA